MDLVLQHWSYDPFLPVVAVIAGMHELGLRRLNRRSQPAVARRRRLRSLWFYLGLGVLLVAVESPIDYWSDYYFWVHMIQHLLLIFAAPVPIVAGAPWQPLQHGIPAGLRRRLARAMIASSRTAIPRRLFRWLRSPWVAVIGLNAALVLWHLPAPFDLAEDNPAVHVWLMHGSFFVFGVLFWLQLIESRPFRIRLSPAGQILAIFATANVMFIMAMALSVFSSGSWYPWYLHQEPAYAAFADQQLGAGIMWTCGDVWAVPAMVVAVRRLIDQRRRTGGLELVVGSLVRGRRPGRVHARLAGLEFPASEERITVDAQDNGDDTPAVLHRTRRRSRGS